MKHRVLWIVIGLVVVVCAVLGLLAAAALVTGSSHYVYIRPMIRSYGFPIGFGGFYGLGRMVLGLLFWGVVIGGGVVLVGALIFRGRRHPADSLQPYRREESAMGILRQRYARGEITREEYDMMKETLTQDTPTERKS